MAHSVLGLSPETANNSATNNDDRLPSSTQKQNLAYQRVPTSLQLVIMWDHFQLGSDQNQIPRGATGRLLFLTAMTKSF